MTKSIWPEWQLCEEIGRGSYGVVYSAVRSEFNMEHKAAIKVITIPSNSYELDSLRSEGLGIDGTRTYLQQVVNEFVREIELMMELQGKTNIVSIQNYQVIEKTEEIGWEIYIRMELLTPFNVFASENKLQECDILRLGCDICTALELCGHKGIIHRDIKPENIFVDDFGNFKLGDFGIARKLDGLSGGLSYKGTPNYMAPEVVHTGNYDARVDQYSLGLVLYKLLNDNHLPFLENESQIPNLKVREEAIQRRLMGESLPAPCRASAVTAAVILRACAYDREQRYPSATAMKAALEQAGDDLQNKTRRGRRLVPEDGFEDTMMVQKFSEKRRKSKKKKTTRSRRKKWPVILAGIVAVVILGSLIKTGDPEDEEECREESAPVVSMYSKSDEEKIALVIKEAESLAAADDYEAALDEIETCLEAYPESRDLLEKAEEYEDALN